MGDVAPTCRRYNVGRFGCSLWAALFVVILVALAEMVSIEIGFRPAIGHDAATSN
jgi:hypothetical protein